MTHTVPFYENTSDDTHCFQAALKMVIGYFQPERSFSWEELDALTGKFPGLWTWPMQGMLWLLEQGYEVQNIELFDYATFAERGEAYLIEMFGEEVAREQVSHSNLQAECLRAKQFEEQADYEIRVPTMEDVRALLDQGFLAIVNVNGHALDGREGYSGHVVVVIGYDDAGFILHDPGLPPEPNRHVSHDLFQRAWAYPDEDAANVIAVKKTKEY